MLDPVSQHSNNCIAKNPLGTSGIEISQTGFGAASLGNLYREISDAQALETIDAAWDAGIRYFDTAPYYGFGLSERRIGDGLRARPRASYAISTKVGRKLIPVADHEGTEMRHGFCSPMPFEPEYDYSYDGIMRSYEDSLQRLGLGRIDILLVHDIGKMTHGEENARHFRDLANGGYRALEELRGTGAISAVGLGVNECSACEEAMEIGQFDCFLLAGRYTLLEQDALNSLLPKCKRRGARIIIGGAYNSGILATGVRKGGEVFYNYAPAPPEIIDRVDRIETVCADHNVSLPAAALQFPLAHDCVATVVPGIGSAHRISQTMDLARATIPTAFWDELRSAGLIDERAPTP